MSDPAQWVSDLIGVFAVGLTIYGKLVRVHKDQQRMNHELGCKVDKAQRTAEKAIRLARERYAYDKREEKWRNRGKRWYDRV